MIACGQEDDEAWRFLDFARRLGLLALSVRATHVRWETQSYPQKKGERNGMYRDEQGVAANQ